MKETHTHNHDHHHESETVSCSASIRKVSKRERLLILILSLTFALVFLRPFISFQSMMRGYSYTELGEPQKAIKHLKRAISLYEKNDQAWSLLAYNLNKLKRTDESIDAYKKALKLNPKDVQAATEFALILFYQNKYKSAAEILEKHLERKPEYVGSWLLLGRCYEKMNDKERAIKIYREIYKKIDPGNQVAKEKLETYNSL